ncbi:MAG: hydrogenase maturation protease [Gammaproteobacteria bacterium]|nr:hydrogenase maturation protease [Gammaproteobacteria bacterium]
MGRLLILACGNPSRGDDALGPLLIERLDRELTEARGSVAALVDFQLQIEHVLDLDGAECVIFVDAASTGRAPFDVLPVRARADAYLSTHAVSPSALLALCARVIGRAPPPAWVLAIRGYEFTLGAPLSAPAGANLERARRFLARAIRTHVIRTQSVARTFQGRPRNR